MTDVSDIQINMTHDQIEEIIRGELRDAIKTQKTMINQIERRDHDDEHEDLVYAKQFVRGAAVVLKYYTVYGSDEWKEIDEISDGE